MHKRWKLFADEYLKTWNATRAYRLAYPDAKDRTCQVNGHKLLSNTEIVAYFQAHQMKPEEIIGRFEDQARGVADYIDPISGQVEMRRLVADGKGHLIKKQKKNMGVVEVEFYDAQTALTMLAKHQKLINDKTEVDIGDKLAAKFNKFEDLLSRIYGKPDSPGEVPDHSA